MARLVLYDTGPSQRSLLSITPRSINALEQYIRWIEVEVPRNLVVYMDDLVHRMALINQMEARKLSFGPYDPNEKNSSLAFRLPVRRISQRYYLGWRVRQKGPAHWQLFNSSREAYYIEFGISSVGYRYAIRGQRIERLGARRTPSNRVRRPVRKLSLRRTMEYMMRTQAYHRIWVDIYANPRTRHRGSGFTQIVQSPGMGTFTGPMLGRELPG